MAQGGQKVDHRGNFLMVPRMLLDSVAWRSLGMRARAALQLIHMRHNGWNNGAIAIGVKELSRALGDQNHRATSLALTELIEKGFLECTCPADWPHSKTREYRLTFVSTGEPKRIALATNEYLEWRPQPGTRRKFGGAVSATQNGNLVTDTATSRKFPVIGTATSATEIRGVEATFQVADPTTLIGNHLSGSAEPPKALESFHGRRAVSSAAVEPDELRQWVRRVVLHHGYGGQKKLALDAGLPEPVLSKFRTGRSLPAHYQLPLQEACGRALPYIQWKALAA